MLNLVIRLSPILEPEPAVLSIEHNHLPFVLRFDCFLYETKDLEILQKTLQSYTNNPTSE